MFIEGVIVFPYVPSDLDTRFPSRRICASPDRVGSPRRSHRLQCCWPPTGPVGWR